MPSFLEYCSARPPLLGVYCATTETNPSAKLLMEEMRDVKVEDEDEYVPTAMLDWNVEKKGWETDVTLREPCAFQTVIAS